MPQVVALAGALADAGEHGDALVLGADVADQLLDDDRLARARTAVRAHLAAPGERRDKVHHLHAHLEHLDLGRLLVELGRVAVNRPVLRRLDLLEVVYRVPEGIEQPAQGRVSDRDGDGAAGVLGLGPAFEAVGRPQGETSHPVVADVLLHLQNEFFAVDLSLHRIEDRGHLPGGKLHVHDGADYLGYFPGRHLVSLSDSPTGRWRPNPAPPRSAARSGAVSRTITPRASPPSSGVIR